MADDLHEYAPGSTDDDSEVPKRSADENVLQFLDSVDDYLTLMGSLSSSLSQGWMEIASARHSMGVTRVSSALFDLKSHSAVTTLHLDQNDENQLQFELHKWGFHETGAKQLNDDAMFKEIDASPRLRRRGSTEVAAVEQDSTKGELLAVDLQVQKERAKSLSVFGKLVSPKLRSAQLSFERTLETLALLANMRSTLLHSADNVRKDMETVKP